MQEHQMNEDQLILPEEESVSGEGGPSEKASGNEKEQKAAELKEANERYLRLYAEFENYKKRVNKDKEELIKYGNESLLYELLTVLDNLDMALKHAPDTISSGLVQGVEITYKELMKTLEKVGLTAIDAEGKPFDPLVHHAMSQIERDDLDENIVAEEYRRGYKLREKVLRPSLVAVSKKPLEDKKKVEKETTEINNKTEEET
jgi:molecular chaperone GrpE